MILRLSLLAMCAALALPATAETVQGTVLPFKKVSVPSPVLQEIIVDMKVREGSEVKEGDIIVELRKEREELDVLLSKKMIQLNSFVARGQKRLFKEQMGSEEKALEAQTNLELSEMQMKSKEIALTEKTVRAPLSGVVVKVYKERGESVDRTEKLMDIVNLDKVYAQFSVKPGVRPTLKEGQMVKVRVQELENAEFEGKVDFIDPQNDAASGFVRIKILIDNVDHRIKPGMQSLGEFGK